MWPKNASTTHIITFVAVTVSASLILALLLSNKPDIAFSLVGILMVFPMMTAMAVNILHHEGQAKIIKTIFPGITKRSVIFAILYPIAFLTLLILIGVVSRLATINFENLMDLKDLIILPISLALAMLVAFGEEYGWRGFLLPALASRIGKFKATATVGLIWALYHAPAIYLMSSILDSQNPMQMSLLQGGIVFCLSFPLAYCYFLGKGSLIPVLLFRAVWNSFNGIVIGSNLAEANRFIQGNPLIVNGEGILGLVLGLIAIYLFYRLLQAMEKKSEQA